MKSRLVTFTVTVLTLLSFNLPPVWANTLVQVKKDGLRVCMEPGYMPFEMKNKQGEIIGFDADLAALIAKQLETKTTFISTPWNDLIPALMDNKCDIIISGMTITEERRQKIDFTESYISIGQALLLRKELADKIRSYKDLNDAKYKVATKVGSTSETTVKESLSKAQFVPVKLEQDGVMEVVNGKADAFIYDSPYISIALVKFGQGKVVFLDSPITFEHLGFGVRKGDNEFREWLNGFLKKIGNNEKYQLYRKWLKNTDWLKDVE